MSPFQKLLEEHWHPGWLWRQCGMAQVLGVGSLSPALSVWFFPILELHFPQLRDEGLGIDASQRPPALKLQTHWHMTSLGSLESAQFPGRRANDFLGVIRGLAGDQIPQGSWHHKHRPFLPSDHGSLSHVGQLAEGKGNPPSPSFSR